MAPKTPAKQKTPQVSPLEGKHFYFQQSHVDGHFYSVFEAGRKNAGGYPFMVRSLVTLTDARETVDRLNAGDLTFAESVIGLAFFYDQEPLPYDAPPATSRRRTTTVQRRG